MDPRDPPPGLDGAAVKRKGAPVLAGGTPRRGKDPAVVQGDVVAPAVIRRARPEAKFQKAVTDLMDLYRWRWHHEVDSRRSKRGLPDLIAVRGGRLLFIELKAARGRLSDDQIGWLCDIKQLACREVEVYIWRPGDLDEIERLLV